ncbi:MAG: nitrate reductase, partial [Comamonadaceae bacterium]
WQEHRDSTRGRDLDITGLSWSLLEERGPQQWPLPEGAAQGTARLYEDGVFPTADGRARFAAHAWRPVAEPRESRFPFSLTTGRLRDQWHGMSRTGTLGRLFGHVAEPSLQMNPADMAQRGWQAGELVHVTSKRGSIVVPVQPDATLVPQQVFMAMHWGGEYLGGRSSTGQPLAGVNALTTSDYCPTSKQPELKHAAVKVLKAELPWNLLAMAWLPQEDALAARQQLAALMRELPFASCVPFSSAGTDGTPRTGVLLRGAAYDPPEGDLLTRIEGLLGLTVPEAVRYVDRRHGQHRTARLMKQPGGGTTLQAVLLGGDTRSAAWMRTLLQEELPAQAYGRMLLVPSIKPPVAVQSRGKPVCVCLNVTDMSINTQLASCRGTDTERLAQLQGALRCGTQCGSCVPELKRMVRATAPVGAAGLLQPA